MAKASQADMEMAMKLCSALEALDRRFFPEGAEGNNDPEDFDRDNDEHCGMALRHVLDILQGGSIGRVIWGMYVMLDPSNKVVDPDADTLEDHPETVSAFEDAKRLDFLDRNMSMKMGWYVGAAPAGNIMVSSVIQPNGQTSIRTAIDSAMAMPSNARLSGAGTASA